MSDPNPTRGGSFARASFVLAFVKAQELSRFVLENQPLRAIARYYDRNLDTIVRAIELLRKHEAAIANRDYMTVAKEVWRGHLGWEKSKSFLEAQGYIVRGELMPKFAYGPQKKKSRRRPSRGGEQTSTPNPQPSGPDRLVVIHRPSPNTTVLPAPATPSDAAPKTQVPIPPPTPANPATKPTTPAVDDVFASMASDSPLLQQVKKVATSHAKPPHKP